MTNKFALHHGDCLEVLRAMPDSYIDSIVTDPPYGLSFMGKRWDYDVPSVEIWTECLRVLKPGGHLLAFAGTRTQHRMAARIEDAGFEVRDMIFWCYGSGFPKSRNIANDMNEADAEAWQGWGTALKPALEPITVARKPLVGTVAANVMAHGTGALNIDGCRVPTEDKLGGGNTSADVDRTGKHEGWQRPWMTNADAAKAAAERSAASVARSEVLGRWPANLIHSGEPEVLACFPDSNGSGPARTLKRGQRADGDGWGMQDEAGALRDAGTGSAARFFYCAKASKKDRGEGNAHPTVKPTDLMAYLCRLVTPPGGVVLDPFMGSGSTGLAALREGFRFVGIEREAQYMDIARARIHGAIVTPAPDLFSMVQEAA